MRRALETLFFLLAATALAGCATDKLWVGAQIVTNNDEAEVEKGAERHKRMLEQVGAYDDPTLSQHIQAIGEKIAAVSDRPKLRWHFTVLDSATPNAFATEGGYVYITRGMLALLQSDTELAAILAHESAHICARDSLHQQRVGNMMGIGMLGAIIAAPELLLFPQVVAAPAGAGMAAISRKDELKADQLGTEYLRRAGYPPETMQTTMTLLESMEAYEQDRQKAAGQKPSGWWHRVYASHPTAEARQEKLAAATSTPRPGIAAGPQPAFLALLNGVEFGSGKFEGIPYGHKRYFVQINIALEVPEGWLARTSQDHDRLLLARTDGKAYMIIEPTTASLTDPCDSLARQMKISEMVEAKPIVDHDMPSCTCIAHRSTKGLFGYSETVFRAGVVIKNKTAIDAVMFGGYSNKALFAQNDAVFLSIARSIEPLPPGYIMPKPLAIHIRRALPGDTFASLAHSSRLPGKNTESLLRLLNRRYPAGEPAAGELIKIIE